jgi:hypothetical protein
VAAAAEGDDNKALLLPRQEDDDMGLGMEAVADGSATGLQAAPFVITMDNSNDQEERCRICLGEGSVDDVLIWPCHCVAPRHRSCLDQWRAGGQSSTSFTHCEVCGFQYQLMSPPEAALDTTREKCRTCKFYAFVARDSLLFFLLMQALIMLLGWGVYWCDSPRHNLEKWLPTSVWIDVGERGIYYVCGLLVFMLLLGLGGSIAMCAGVFPGSTEKQRNHAAADTCCMCNCGGCEGCNGCGGGCSGGGGGGGSGDGICLGVLMVLLLIVVAVLVAIGIFVLVFVASLLLQRIIQRHTHRLWLKQEAKAQRVVDFTRTARPVPIRPSAPLEVLMPSASVPVN